VLEGFGNQIGVLLELAVDGTVLFGQEGILVEELLVVLARLEGTANHVLLVLLQRRLCPQMSHIYYGAYRSSRTKLKYIYPCDFLHMTVLVTALVETTRKTIVRKHQLNTRTSLKSTLPKQGILLK
jgi:hypothetical protein